VFYSGFTRAFLKGETESSEQLLQKAKEAVEKLSSGKKICIIDGVGYPAVGSICGVSNAAVACTLNSPVLLVGPKGVGNAVDSFNLNEAFFRAHSISSPSSVQQITVPGNGSLCTTYSIAVVATFVDQLYCAL
jgi:hypothetical protein